MVGFGSYDQRQIRQAFAPVKPKVFVSYHHNNDQQWYNSFSDLFSGVYDLFTDTSLERKYDSNDTGYVDRAIRENNITGSSVTVVLCGAETFKRKYVDWEIYATLYKEHGLVGIILPTIIRNIRNQPIVPDRLAMNIHSGYAHWIDWSQNPVTVRVAIDEARSRTSKKKLIANSIPKMARDQS